MKISNKLMITAVLCLVFIIVGCGGTEAVEQSAIDSSGDSAESATTANTATETEDTPAKTRLNADFADAMSVQAQLEIGTLQLESGDNPIDEALAAELLPLWQAVQALSASESSAAAEVTAVVNQIQDTMQPEQIETIAAMNLTPERLQEMVESGEIQIGRQGGRGQGGQGGGQDGGQGGGRGGQGGGLLGGQGGGQGGQGGQGLGNLSEDEIATRRAERFGEDGGPGQLGGQGQVNAVIRLLQQKTGVEVAPGGPGGGGFGGPRLIATEVVAEQLGITVEAVREQSADKTLLVVIEENDGDVESIVAALSTALSDDDGFAAEDPDAFAQSLLDGTFAGGGRQPQGDQ